MWLRIALPAFARSDAVARLARLHASPGTWLDRGASLLDLTVDMSGGVVRDCPPVSTCRIVLQEPLWLRSLHVEEGEPIGAGATLALLSTDERSDPEDPAREARIAVASILAFGDWWSGAA
jgi:hypothetical protein